MTTTTSTKITTPTTTTTTSANTPPSTTTKPTTSTTTHVTLTSTTPTTTTLTTNNFPTAITNAKPPTITSPLTTTNAMVTPTTTATTPTAVNSPSDSSTDAPLYFKSFNNAKGSFSVDLTLKFNMTFVDDLNDPQSAEYKNTAQDFTAMLTPIYQQIPSFIQIVIVDLKPGSIIVLYTTQFSLSSNDNVTELLKSSQAPLSRLPNIDSDYLAFSYPTQISIAASTIREVLNDSCKAVGICDPGYTCRADLKKCVHKCVNFTCSQNAECYLNEYDQPQCRCKQSDKYIFSGTNCSVVQEKLSMGSTEIIALGVSISLAAIIVAVILTLAITRCRRRRKQAADEQSNFVTSEFEDNSTPWPGPEPLRLALSGNEIHRDRPTSSGNNRNLSLLPDNDDRLRELGAQDVIYIPDPVYPGRRDQLSRTDPYFRYSEGDLSERRPTSGKPREDSPRESAQLRIHPNEPRQGLPLAYNPRIWSYRPSYWSDDAGEA